MKSTHAAMAVAGMLFSSTVLAGGAFTGRVGVSGGNYKQEVQIVDQGCCGNPVGTEFSDDYDTTQYGVLAGVGLTAARFFTDVGLEYVKYADDADTNFDGVEDTAFYRSDFLLTLGAFIGDHWSAFGGYRYSTQGDGFFSEDQGYTTDGPFIGGGFAFRPAKKLSLGGSAAYNFLTYSEEGQVFEEFDFSGFSVKVQMGFLGTPHAVFLRWQRFEGDESEAGSYDYEETHDYLNVGYQATFDFASW